MTELPKVAFQLAPLQEDSKWLLHTQMLCCRASPCWQATSKNSNIHIKHESPVVYHPVPA